MAEGGVFCDVNGNPPHVTFTAGRGELMTDEKVILLERLKERLAVVRARLYDYTRGKRPWFEADCREAEELFVDIRRLEPGFERRD